MREAHNVGAGVLGGHSVGVAVGERYVLDEAADDASAVVRAGDGAGNCGTRVVEGFRQLLANDTVIVGTAHRGAELLEKATKLAPDIVLLDNMTLGQVKDAVQQTNGRVPLEVSGGVHLGNVRDYALTGVDFISVGALSHSFKSADISLELKL